MSKRVAVIGDFGLDRYWIGEVRGLSAEAPIPVLTSTTPIDLPGMGGNVVENLRLLGMDVVEVRVEGRCPLKNRLYTPQGDQLARFDQGDECIPYTMSDLIPLLEVDAVVVADYGKGSITPQVVDLLVSTSVAPEGLKVFVDTKRDPSPWIGSGATLFPNQEEYRRFEEKYAFVGEVVLKRGAAGMAYLQYGQVVHQLPSLARYARCVNGAGDSALAGWVAAWEGGGDPEECLSVASAVAGCVVEQEFLHRTVTKEGLGAWLTSQV
jgi:D-beta-D-heptose 7-phosphate kinase / D-beta-D-heptose 1-phosphate adenosyltransferase